MTFRKLYAAAAVVAPMLLGTPASADVISDIVNSGGGQYQIKFTNFEDFTSSTLAPGTQNFGVFEVTSINAVNTGAPVPITGGFLVGLFSGIDIASVSGGISLNTGGVFSLYEVSSLPDFTQALNGYTSGGCVATNTQCYNGITNAVGGVNVLNWKLVPGIINGDTTTTLKAQVDGTTVPVTGNAEGFADITGGTDAAFFQTGNFATGIGTLADIFFQDDFCAEGSPACGTNGWSEKSDDPVTVNLVPEPGSIAVLGTALMSFGFFGRRRNKKSSNQ